MVCFSKFDYSQKPGKDGQPRLICQDTDGYLYTLKKKTKSHSVWKCRLSKCSALAYIDIIDPVIGDSPNLRLGSSQHNHSAPPLETLDAINVTRALKRKAMEQDLAPTQNMISEVLAHTTPEVNCILPKFDSLQRITRRARAGDDDESFVAKQRAAIILSENSCLSHRGDIFLLYDEPGREDRIIVFGTDRNKKMLKKYRLWMADGTFWVTPDLFYQTFTVHACINGVALPLIYALLPNKKSETYLRFANVLKDWCGDEEGCLMFDFETGILPQFRSVFPDHIIKLCYFHLTQNLQKNVSNKHKKQYSNDENFAQAVRLLAALAFVPLDRIESALEVILDHFAETNTDLLPIYWYFEKYYIGELVAQDLPRTTPTYPVGLWNFYADMTTSEETQNYPRTINKCEAWHGSFRKRFTSAHPTLKVFIRALKLEQARVDYFLDRLIKNNEPPTKRPRKDHKELIAITKKFGDYESMKDYLFDLVKIIGFPVKK